MKRLLCIIWKMSAGGAQSMLMKLYREMDRSKVQFDFLIQSGEVGFHDNEINNLGGKIYYSKCFPVHKHPISSFLDVYKVVKKEKYQHILMSTKYSHETYILLAAKFAGAEIIGIRSTNSKTSKGDFVDAIERYLSFIPRIVSNVRLAPSRMAADFLFGENSVEKCYAKILHNGVDISKFTFDENKRNRVRQELLLENYFVVGHVGRLQKQKNHKFLIEIFKEIKSRNDKSKLLLIGDGELENELKKYVSELGMQHDVIFAGIRNDVDSCLMAMDVMVFPSFYEGLPNVVIEAQTTGLPCIMSDSITTECNVTDVVKFLSLSSNAEQWANEAIKNVNIKRHRYSIKVSLKGYNVNDVANYFVKYMLGSGEYK